MNYYDLEFSFHAYISEEETFQAFSSCWEGTSLKLVTFEEYINLMDHTDERMPDYLGIEPQWEEQGYRTWVRGIYYGEELPGRRLGDLCRCLAKQLNTEVATGDFMHSDDYVGLYIVYSPSGEYWFAYEVDVEEGFDLERVKTSEEDRLREEHDGGGSDSLKEQSSV